MSIEVLFKKRTIDKEEYSLGAYSSEIMASIVAKGEYYYRGGVTPDYRFVRSNKKAQGIPEHLYDVLVGVVGFLSSEEQEVFRNEHVNYLSRTGKLHG